VLAGQLDPPDPKVHLGHLVLPALAAPVQQVLPDQLVQLAQLVLLDH
jgi:hypothetical protein